MQFCKILVRKNVKKNIFIFVLKLASNIYLFNDIKMVWFVVPSLSLVV